MPRARRSKVIKFNIHKHTPAVNSMWKSIVASGYPVVTEGSTSIPNRILTDPRISVNARVLYGVSKCFATPHPSGGLEVGMHSSNLATFLDRGERTLASVLLELEGHDLIEYLDPNHSTAAPATYLLKGG